MDGKSYVMFVALAFVGAGLAGCIESPDWLNTNDVEVSALENKALADRAAAEWRPGAELVGVMAFELAESPDPRIDADPDPGNGLAPAWWFVYCDAAMMEAPAEAGSAEETSFARGGEASMSSSKMSGIRAFKVSSDGTVTSEDDAEAFAAGMDHSMVSPIEGWEIDSDEALRAAAEDASFAKVAQGYNATVVEGVAHYEGATSWWVSAMSADGFVVATVDATSGELLSVMPMDMDFEMPGFEWGAANPELMPEPVVLEGEGTATPQDEPVEVPFSVAAPMAGIVAIEFATQMPTDGLHWAILDAERELVAVDHLRSWSGSGSYETDVEIEEPGEYVFTIYYMESYPTGGGFLPLGGAVDYEFLVELEAGHLDHEDEDEG